MARATVEAVVLAACVPVGGGVRELTEVEDALREQARAMDRLAVQCAVDAREVARRLTDYAERIGESGPLYELGSPLASSTTRDLDTNVAALAAIRGQFYLLFKSVTGKVYGDVARSVRTS